MSKIALMGTSGSRMRPETQIRANASKLWGGDVCCQHSKKKEGPGFT